MAIGKNKANGTVKSTGSVKLFENIVAKSYENVLSTFQGADVSEKARRAAILRQLDQIVQETHIDLNAWAVTQIPAFYEAGAFEFVRDAIKGGQNIDFTKNFSTFHAEAIASLVNQTSGDIASAMTGMQKMNERLLSQATRDSLLEKVATGKISGDTRKAITKNITKELKANGVDALTDKGGRTWDLATYGKMLARTKLTQAHNQGVSMRLAQEGNDLVIVSDHIGECASCAPWENKILSVSGKNGKYPSLNTAMAEGLFHPNCRHVISPLPNDSEYLNESMVWDANQQRYVPFNGVNTAEMNKPTKSPVGKDVAIGKGSVVYRATDSTNKDATLGNGTYFAFDRANVERYGKNIQTFTIPEGTKMLRLDGYNGIDRFIDAAKKDDHAAFVALVDKYGMEEANARLIASYAQKLGYAGIIGDDDVFGSVLFDRSLMKSLGAKEQTGAEKVLAGIFGKKDVPKLNDFENSFIERTKLYIEDGASKKNNLGAYTPATHAIVLRRGKGVNASTFYHELGHAIDFRTSAVGVEKVKFGGVMVDKKVYKNLSKETFRELPKDELRQIVYERARGASKIQFPDEKTFKDYMLGMGVEVDGNKYSGMSKKYRQYIFGYDEIFADGYAQYRVDRTAFEKYAPSVTKYFDKITK